MVSVNAVFIILFVNISLQDKASPISNFHVVLPETRSMSSNDDNSYDELNEGSFLQRKLVNDRMEMKIDEVEDFSDEERKAVEVPSKQEKLKSLNDRMKNDADLRKMVNNLKKMKGSYQELNQKMKNLEKDHKDLQKARDTLDKKHTQLKNYYNNTKKFYEGAKKRVDDLKFRSNQVQNVLRYSNPFYLLGAYPNVTLDYFNSYPDGRPFYNRKNYGLHNDADYCEMVDFYNLAHPENMFKRKNFFTDYAKNGLARTLTMRKIGYDLSWKISKYMPKSLFKSVNNPYFTFLLTFLLEKLSS